MRKNYYACAVVREKERRANDLPHPLEARPESGITSAVHLLYVNSYPFRCRRVVECYNMTTTHPVGLQIDGGLPDSLVSV